MTKPEFDILFGLYAEEQGLSAEMRRQVLETVERTTAYTSVDEAPDLYRMLNRVRDELGDQSARHEVIAERRLRPHDHVEDTDREPRAGGNG
ncbi:MAG: hypothetical protein NT039_03115, partial [Candidatus Berkelbacteria bacterium]|nr:hypothetical protein [Candidatus Berkelbacteria bacterium]